MMFSSGILSEAMNGVWTSISFVIHYVSSFFRMNPNMDDEDAINNVIISAIMYTYLQLMLIMYLNLIVFSEKYNLINEVIYCYTNIVYGNK